MRVRGQFQARWQPFMTTDTPDPPATVRCGPAVGASTCCRTCSRRRCCSRASTRSWRRPTATSTAPASPSSSRWCSTGSTAASRAGPTRRANSARSTTACPTWSRSASHRRSSPTSGASRASPSTARLGPARLARDVLLRRIRGVPPRALQCARRDRRQALFRGTAEPVGRRAARRLRLDARTTCSARACGH